MELTLDQVRKQLADIHEELLTLPADDFDRRAELQEQRNELRQLSHKLIDGQPLHDGASLRAAFQRLEEVRDRLLEKRLSESASTSVGDAGIDSEFTSLVNRAIESGLGIDEIDARLREIIEQLRSSS